MLRLATMLLGVCSAALLVMGCAAEADMPEAKAKAAAPLLELTGRVVDAADILSPVFEQSLTAKLDQLEASTQVQLVVVTTPDLQGQAVDTYTTDLANAWGIGSVERDDGLVLLVAPNERKVRIAVGYGLEATVRDEEAGQIIRDTLLPNFRRYDYETGVNAAVERLIDEVTPLELKEAA